MERTFGPGSSQDGEGEVDDDLQEEPESAPPPPLQNGAIPRHPDPFTTQEGPFLNSETQAARMRPPVVEHQVSSGNPYPNQPTQMGHPYSNYPPPDPDQHRHAPNGQFLSGSYAPPLPNGSVPFLPPGAPFPPPLEHDHLYPEPAPPPPPAVDEPSAEDEESGRPRRERAKRDFFSAGSHSGSGGGPSEDGGATGTGSRKGKEKERSSRSHHYDGAGRKSRQEPTGHRKVKVIKRDVPADLECSFCEGDKTRNRDGRPEDMVACYTCGRAGHPTCLQMTSKRLVAMVMSYDWRCIECKPCEICKEKGDDEKILFCDKCDRGTHYDCLDPPLSQPPDGSWACGKCIPLRQTSAAVGYQPRPPKPKHPNQYTNRPPQPNQYSRANQYTSTRPPQPNQYSRPSSSRLYSPDEYQAPGSSSVVSKRAVPRVSYRQDPDDYEEEDDGSPPPLPPQIRLKLKRQRAESEEDDDDVTSKLPFGGVLSGKDADTSRSKIGADDKDRFERSRKAAEVKLGGPRPPAQDPYASMPSTPQALGSPSPSGYYNNSPSTSNSHSDLFPSARPLRDQLLTSQTQDHHLYSRRSQDPSTPGPSNSISNTNSFPFAGSSNGGGPSVFEKIKCIRFGPFDIDTWYTAPYPEEYALVPDGRLWICEFCLKYMKSAFGAGRHRLKCKARHPPGDEVYRDGAVSVFEVDGRKNKIYCQNLCLLAKMFLDHKTLYYDVEPFLFYIMTETDDFGARFVGYFSKEKRSPMNYNVSCIMTLPVRQRKGWGNLLIDFSYLLSKKEARVGSPEKPLSDLGLLSYTNYWTVTLFFYLRSAQSPVTIEAISQATSMTAEDILFVLKAKNMITIAHSSPPPPSLSRKTSSLTNSKNTSKARGSSSTPAAALPTSTTVVLHPRGAAVHTAETTRVTQANFIPQDYLIQWNRDEVEQYLVKFEGKGWLRLRAENLKWTAFTDSLALRALKKKKEKVGVEEVGEKLVGVMEGAGVGGGVVVEGVDGALREGAGAGEVEGPVPMVVDEEPSKDHLEEAVVGNGIVDEDPNHLPLEVAPEDASIPAATEQAPAPAKPSVSGSATIIDDSYPHSATSSPVFGPSFLLDDQPSTSQLDLQPDALPPPPASPTRARRSQSSQLASPPPSNPASQSDDPATLALVAALTSPNRRLRSSSASPTKPKTSEEPPEHHLESSPRKRSTRNASAGVGGEGGASMETEVVGVALPSTTTTNGAGGRSTRSSPRKGAVSAEATDVEEEEGGVEVRV